MSKIIQLPARVSKATGSNNDRIPDSICLVGLVPVIATKAKVANAKVIMITMDISIANNGAGLQSPDDHSSDDTDATRFRFFDAIQQAARYDPDFLYATPAPVIKNYTHVGFSVWKTYLPDYNITIEDAHDRGYSFCNSLSHDQLVTLSRHISPYRIRNLPSNDRALRITYPDPPVQPPAPVVSQPPAKTTWDFTRLHRRHDPGHHDDDDDVNIIDDDLPSSPVTRRRPRDPDDAAPPPARKRPVPSPPLPQEKAQEKDDDDFAALHARAQQAMAALVHAQAQKLIREEMPSIEARARLLIAATLGVHPTDDP